MVPRTGPTGGSLYSALPGGLAVATAAAAVDLERVAAAFTPIGLEEMDRVALLDRFDSKYVIHVADAVAALGGLADHYRILEVEDVRLQPYRTVYFDTEGFALYDAHHCARPRRYKVRSREYVATRTAFLEVKRRGKRDRTVKSRVRTAGLVRRLAPADGAFVEANTPCKAEALQARLMNSFRRITLVSLEHKERVTLDSALSFHVDDRSIALAGAVVIEVKEDGGGRTSAFARELRRLAVHPSSFSKYCIGVALLYPDQKHNRFKPELLRLQRIIEGDSHVN